MSAPTIKSHQYSIELFRNGKKEIINTITNVSVNQDSDFSRSQFVGNPIPEGDQVFNGWSGSFDLEVKTAVVDRLLEGITTQNYNGVGIADINILETEKYSDGQLATFLHTDVQLKMSKQAQGNTKVTKRIDFQSSFRKEI